MPILRYGTEASVRLEAAEGLSPIKCGTPRGKPLLDLSAAVAEALADPLNYPPLARCTTPGDRVVLALEEGLPQANQISAAVIRALVDAGVGPDGITVLRTDCEIQPDPGNLTAENLCRRLPEEICQRIRIYIHDAGDRRQLAYLAANDAGEPILLSREIHDADLVLPIGCLQNETAAGYYGIHGTIFPTFSDRKTRQRFRSPGSLNARGKQRKKLIQEADQVAWLLGISFTVQLIPAGGGSVLHVLAGRCDDVRRQGRELYRQAWSWPVTKAASLVIAAIEGDATQQTWQSFGRAIDAASGLVEDGGSIAVCCDLAAAPGPAMQHLVGGHSRDVALRRIRRERPIDALPAAQLARALDHGKVYLLSRLDPSLVEDLEMIHVAEPAELVRLAHRHKSCILLPNAPHTTVTLD